MSSAFAGRIGGLVLAVVVLAPWVGARPPGTFAQASAPWAAPAPEKAKKNPLPSDKKTLEQGEKVAKTNCVSWSLGGK